MPRYWGFLNHVKTQVEESATSSEDGGLLGPTGKGAGEAYESRAEGMMTEDIEECLRVVLKALRKCDLPADEVIAWCVGMAAKDRVGFICDKELRALKDSYNTSRPR
jgi:hypothetical protein